jgi:hypothetical protein
MRQSPADEPKGCAGPAIPPQPDDIPTRGERGLFHGTNPWSGPYFVVGVIAVVLIFIAAIFIAFLIGVVGSQ